MDWISPRSRKRCKSGFAPRVDRGSERLPPGITAGSWGHTISTCTGSCVESCRRERTLVEPPHDSAPASATPGSVTRAEMPDTITLTLRGTPPARVGADVIAPDRFATLSNSEIGALPLWLFGLRRDREDG